jgi:hypothetical protein
MKQHNDIDIYFKSKVDKPILDFNKDNAWEKLVQQRKKNKIRYVSFSLTAAAIFILGIFLIIPKHTLIDNEYKMSDYQKRQKLKEYESKISGTYEEILLCNDCSGEIFKSQIKQVPEKQWIIKMY